uniref:Uncharacterized protein n=1 Tax=Parascaris univalens TaxID=6257 RepID=A0A914ZWK3_PARUN
MNLEKVCTMRCPRSIQRVGRLGTMQRSFRNGRTLSPLRRSSSTSQLWRKLTHASALTLLYVRVVPHFQRMTQGRRGVLECPVHLVITFTGVFTFEAQEPIMRIAHACMFSVFLRMHVCVCFCYPVVIRGGDAACGLYSEWPSVSSFSHYPLKLAREFFLNVGWL